jgi:uncharacterized SAM-binding protein YcdF (DUF218 family)
MILYLTKLVTLAAYPLTQSLVGLLAGLGLLFREHPRQATALFAASTAWLWLWSMPVVSTAARSSLENLYPQASAEQTPAADGILLLGGGIQGPKANRVYPEFSGAADRIWHAARLYHAHRAPLIIATGGNLPWHPRSTTEAEAMRSALIDFGVPGSAIVLENASRTTRENMRNSRLLLDSLGIKTVLLVTSALHMRRALAEAGNAGIDAFPAPADFEVGEESPTLMDFLPDAGALESSSRAIKERLGCLATSGCR